MHALSLVSGVVSREPHSTYLLNTVCAHRCSSSLTPYLKGKKNHYFYNIEMEGNSTQSNESSQLSHGTNASISPSTSKEQPVRKRRGAKHKLNRHSSLADIAREHKSNARSVENDIRKFYGTNMDPQCEVSDPTNQGDVVFRGHKHHSHHNKHHHDESIEYLTERSNKSNITEHSNFLYRTGSQVFMNNTNQDLTQFSLSMVAHAHVSEHHNIDPSSSHSGSRQSSAPPGSSSNPISRQISHTSTVDEDDESFHSAYSSGESDQEDALLFVGTRLRRRKDSNSSGLESVSSSDDSQLSQFESPKKRRSVWQGIFDILFDHTQNDDEIDDLEYISPYII